jgi:general secretion pathway protein L
VNEYTYSLLRILPDSDPASEMVRWFAGDEQGSSTLSTLPSAQSTELIIPAGLSNIYIAELPRQSLARRQKLLPHLLEDRLLSPAATLHFGLKEHSNKIIAADRKWLAHYLQRLSEHGINPTAVWSIYDFLPDDTGWCVIRDQQACLVRTAENQYSYFDDAGILELLIGDAPRQDIALDQLILNGKPGTNLLQGDFARQSQWNFDWKLLHTPALLLGAVFAVILLGQAGDWWQLRSTKMALQREMRQTYVAAFPGEPVFDPVLQLQSKLRERGGLTNTQNGDGLDLLLQVAAIAGHGLQLESLQYSSAGLNIDIPASQASSLQSQLKSAGLSAETQPAATGRSKLLIRTAAAQ